MSKNVGLVRVPMEFILDLDVPPEDLRTKLVLPGNVNIYQTYEDFYRQTFNFMLISTVPVDGVTYPTAPGCEVPEAIVNFRDGLILVGNKGE